MEISIFLKNISYQTSIQFQYLMHISHRFKSGKFAKRPNENVWYGPEKTVERHLKGCFEFSFFHDTLKYTNASFLNQLLKLYNIRNENLDTKLQVNDKSHCSLKTQFIRVCMGSRQFCFRRYKWECIINKIV